MCLCMKERDIVCVCVCDYVCVEWCVKGIL